MMWWFFHAQHDLDKSLNCLFFILIFAGERINAGSSQEIDVKNRSCGKEDMKREFLEKLGLEKDAIDQVMAENGKDIEAEKAKTTAMTAERDKLQASLDDANKTIKGYKDMDIEAIKQSASDWEEKAKKAKADLEALRQDAELDKALAGSNTIDADLLKKALDHDAISYKDGKFVGLDEQIKALQKDKPYLFKEKSESNGANPKDGFEPFTPPAGDDGASATGTLEQQINAILGI